MREDDADGREDLEVAEGIFDTGLEKLSSSMHLSQLDILCDGLQQQQGCQASIWCNKRGCKPHQRIQDNADPHMMHHESHPCECRPDLGHR